MLLALEIPPDKTDQLFWTDFIELRALIHPDKCFSYGDLYSLQNRVRDIKGYTFPAEARWRDLISFAEVRSFEYSEAYPFQVSEDGDTLALNFDPEKKEQVTYLNLLLASLMRHIPDNCRGDLARYFEEACFKIFQNLMPQGAQTRATWAGGGDEAPYQGTLFEKMQLIASDIRCKANFEERDFKKNDRGDGGIDLISWHPMADERKGIPIAFAQCGCSKNQWDFKQLEASPAKHYPHFPVLHPWATYYFLPLDLRDADGGWAYESDIGQAIFVDRLRLIRLADEYQLHDDLPNLELLDTVMDVVYS